MRYAAIRDMDISNGTGVGVSLFVQGCPIHCEGCFNQSTWDFNGGKEWTDEAKDKLIQLMKHPYIKRLSILGGEPFADQNFSDVVDLIYIVDSMKVSGELPADFKVWLYTGYHLAGDISDHEIFQLVDYIVDGPYIQELRDITLKFRGSSNQRIVDCKASIEAGKIVTAFD